LIAKLTAPAFELLESVLRNIGSPVGILLRRAYYRVRLKSCGKKVCIDCGVFLTNPQYITLGDNVTLDKHVVITAGPAGHPERTRTVRSSDCVAEPGYVIIGKHSHVGIGTIIQGHGGVVIGEDFTSSSHCTIYSLSNDPKACRHGTVGADGRPVYYVATPTYIGRNVWLGLKVIVVGHTIGDDVFVKACSVVSANLEANSICAGQPAARVGPRFPDLIGAEQVAGEASDSTQKF